MSEICPIAMVMYASTLLLLEYRRPFGQADALLLLSQGLSLNAVGVDKPSEGLIRPPNLWVVRAAEEAPEPQGRDH